MRRIAGLGSLLTVAVVLAAARPASAQRGVSIDRFEPALDRHGFLGVQGTRMPGPGQWDFALWLSWSENLLEVQSASGATTVVVNHRLRTDAIAQVGLGGRFALALDVPVAWYQAGDTRPLADGEGDLPTVAAGDPRLVLRARMLGEPSGKGPDERAEGFGLAALASVTAPIGSDHGFVAEASSVTDLQLLGDFHVLGLGIGLSLGWKHRFREQTIVTVRTRDELHYGLGLEVPVPLGDGLSALLEVRGWTDARSPFGDEARSGVEGDLGARWRHGDWALTATVGTGFTAAVGTPQVRGVAGVAWSPRVHDADGDGIPDDRDECVHLPEDFDGYQDADGCLDPDNDGDLVPDDDDRCPNEAAEEGRDEDFDGCTDPVRDADHDGIEDRDDRCPRRAEDEDGFEDADGCPDPDNDADGVPDRLDKCPLAPEDRDGFEDRDGCPDPDNDGDHVADAQDLCPDEAEDIDGFEDTDGCPDPDDDRDGVLDADDQCPTEAETINGRDDGDGCPDRGGRSLWRVRGEPGVTEAEITGAIRFAKDGSLTRLGRAAVDQLARLILSGWPQPARVALAPGDDARIVSLRKALTEDGVPPGRAHIVRADDLRYARVRVTIPEPQPEEAQ